jgi:hypothetical protein
MVAQREAQPKTPVQAGVAFTSLEILHMFLLSEVLYSAEGILRAGMKNWHHRGDRTYEVEQLLKTDPYDDHAAINQRVLSAAQQAIGWLEIARKLFLESVTETFVDIQMVKTDPVKAN